MRSFNSVAVIGAGAWGTALAGVAARAGRDVILYARDAASAARIAATRESPKLSAVRLAANINVTGDIVVAARADIILIATPAQNLRAAVAALAPHLAKATPVIASAKGIERGTHKFMTEVIAETAPDAIPAILSGPSFADDVARGLPTAVTLAAKDEQLASALVQALGSSTFRPYHTTDVRGVEIGGAAKNVLAIAAGIVVGRKLGASAQAALTTRGFSEIECEELAHLIADVLDAPDHVSHRQAAEQVGGALNRGVGQREGASELVGVSPDHREVARCLDPAGVQHAGQGGRCGLVVHQQTRDGGVRVQQGVQLAPHLRLMRRRERGPQHDPSGRRLLERSVLKPPHVGAAAFHHVLRLRDDEQLSMPETDQVIDHEAPGRLEVEVEDVDAGAVAREPHERTGLRGRPQDRQSLVVLGDIEQHDAVDHP